MDRIALVLLHGIGEQRPMATLRGFVQGVFSEPGRSRPDRLSSLFEVRRLDVRAGGFNVDCYELYWAHHMESSTLAHIAKWAWRLFKSPPKKLEAMAEHLDGRRPYTATQLAVGLLVGMVMASVILALWARYSWTWLDRGAGAVFVAVVVAILGFLRWWASRQMVEVVGDAARYLDNAPANVGVRQAIRTECVRFLEKLTRSEAPSYSRIVVVGHSLGSFIAYDALRLLWAQLDPHLAVPASVTEDRGLLAWLHGGKRPAGEKASSPQRALFEQASPPQMARWKISDLVTVGSPLAHAPLLLAESMEDFRGLQHQRELPTCPPQRDEDSRYCGWAEGAAIKLHHAAPFAVVQWTNLYFPTDPIGGPLRQIFGKGIVDVELPDAPTKGWSDHLRYWARGAEAGSRRFRNEIWRSFMNDEEWIARRWFEQAWNERDESVVDELLATDATGHMAHGKVEGSADFKQVRAEFLRAFPDLRLEIEEVLTAPGKAAVRWRFTGTHSGAGFELAPTGDSPCFRGTTWLRIEDSRIVEGWDTWDRGALLARLEAHQPAEGGRTTG